MKKIAILIICLIIPCSAWAAMPQATSYVSPSGSGSSCTIGSPCSLAYANTNADDDDIVYLRGGTYSTKDNHGVLEPDNDGSSGQPITFIAYTAETPIIDGTNVDNNYAMIRLSGRSYITIDGLTTQNAQEKYGVAVGGGGSSLEDDIIIQNCTFNGHGINAKSVDNFQILDNAFVDIDDYAGINISGSENYKATNIEISRNTFTGDYSDTDAISIHEDSSVPGQGMGNYHLVEDNTITMSGGENCIDINSGLYVVVRDNTCTGSNQPGIIIAGNNTTNLVDYVRIIDNVVHTLGSGSEHFMVTGEGRDHLQFIRNIAYGTGEHNIRFFNSASTANDGIRVAHNVFDGRSLRDNINFQVQSTDGAGVTDVSAKNNIFIMSSGDSAIYWAEPGAADMLSDYNLYYNVDSDPADIWGYTPTYSLTQVRSTYSREDGGIEGNPDVVSLSTPDYNLKGDSPAIDAGGWLTTEDDGRTSSGTTLYVEDALWFYDGWNITGEVGDTIKAENGDSAVISSINYSTNTITLGSSITHVDGQGIGFDYEGDKPDIGAYESDVPHYVSPSGSDTWANSTNINTPCSLTTAEANADDGDLVYLRDGTYTNETLTPANSGSSGNVITFQAYTSETPILDGTNTIGNAIILDSRDYITIDGLTLRRYKGAYIRSIHATNLSEYLTIQNCTIQEPADSGLENPPSNHAIMVKGNVQHVDILDNVIDYSGSTEKGESGIVIYGATEAAGQVEHTRIEGNTLIGHRTTREHSNADAITIHIADNDPNPSPGNYHLIKNNEIYYWRENCVDLASESEYIVVIDNTLYDCMTQNITGGGKKNRRVQNNDIYGVYNSDSVEWMNSGSSTWNDGGTAQVIGNRFWGSGNGVVYLAYTGRQIHDVYFAHNSLNCTGTPFGDNGGCIYINGSDGNSENINLRNNIFYYPAGIVGIYLNTLSASEIDSDYNVFWHTTSSPGANIWYRNSGRTLTYVKDDGNYDQENHSIEVDPQFKDPIANPTPNLELNTSSEAIDAGGWLTTEDAVQVSTGVTLYVEDARWFIDGEGGTWDIGGLVGDTIMAANGTSGVISSINYTTNTITLASATMTHVNGQGIGFSYNGDRPDIGAYESESPGCDVEEGHLDYCRDCGPCAEGEGDCDADDECAGALICNFVEGTDDCAVAPGGEPVVTIVATDGTATEAGPTVGLFTISCSPACSGETINYTISGTATLNTDYNMDDEDGAITITGSSTTITVIPVDDSDVESTETVYIGIAEGTGYTVATPDEAFVVIVDNDTEGSQAIQGIKGNFKYN